MSKKKSVRIIIGIIALITLFIIVINILFININYKENQMPDSTYKIKISRITRKMTVKEYHSCSAVNCNNRTVKNEVTLTNKEFSMIKKILKTSYNKKDLLVSALSSIAEDDKVFYKKEDSYFEEKDDLNKDGIVTSREFGVSFLKTILKESN